MRLFIFFECRRWGVFLLYRAPLQASVWLRPVLLVVQHWNVGSNARCFWDEAEASAIFQHAPNSLRTDCIPICRYISSPGLTCRYRGELNERPWRPRGHQCSTQVEERDIERERDVDELVNILNIKMINSHLALKLRKGAMLACPICWKLSEVGAHGHLDIFHSEVKRESRNTNPKL